MPILIRLAPYFVCLIFGSYFSYKITADHFRSVIAERDMAAEKSVSEARQHVIDAVQEQQKITTQTAGEYEKKISEIRAKYDADRPSFGLRVSTDSSARGVSTVSKSTSRSDAVTSCDGLSEKLRLAAELQTQQLISLQQWIKDQEKAAGK